MAAKIADTNGKEGSGEQNETEEDIGTWLAKYRLKKFKAKFLDAKMLQRWKYCISA